MAIRYISPRIITIWWRGYKMSKVFKVEFSYTVYGVAQHIEAKVTDREYNTQNAKEIE